VEDNPVDVRMIRYALEQESSWLTETMVAKDGEEAIQYLTQKGSFVGAWRPDFVILDLNLPKRDGTEVLQVIRRTDPLRFLPVFVFSSSPQDVIEQQVHAANVAADQYMTKPSDADDFLALGGTLRRFYHKADRQYGAH
jgi:CheY-like chemotaxis protein